LLNRRIEDLRIKEASVKQKELILDRMKRDKVTKSNTLAFIERKEQLESIIINNLAEMGKPSARVTSMKSFNNNPAIAEKKVCFDIKRTRRVRNLSMVHITNVTLEGIKDNTEEVIYVSNQESNKEMSTYVQDSGNDVKTNSNHGSNITTTYKHKLMGVNNVVIANRIKRKELGRNANRSMIDNRDIIKEVLGPEKKTLIKGKPIEKTIRKENPITNNNKLSTKVSIAMKTIVDKPLTKPIKQPIKSENNDSNKKESNSNKLTTKDFLKEALNKVIKTGKESLISRPKTSLLDNKPIESTTKATKPKHHRVKSAMYDYIKPIETTRKNDTAMDTTKKKTEPKKPIETSRPLYKSIIKESILTKPGSNGSKTSKLKEDLKPKESIKIDFPKDKPKYITSQRNSKEHEVIKHISFGLNDKNEFSFQPKKDTIMIEIPVSNISSQLEMTPKEKVKETIDVIYNNSKENQSNEQPLESNEFDSAPSFSIKDTMPQEVENNHINVNEVAVDLKSNMEGLINKTLIEKKVSSDIDMGEYDNLVYKFNSKIFRSRESFSKSEIDIVIKEEPEITKQEHEKDKACSMESDEEESNKTF
jgi:hypothetical protein